MRRSTICTVCDLDWHKDLSVSRKFHAGFGNTPINPDEPDQTLGAPLAIMNGNEIVSFAIPFSFIGSGTAVIG